MALRANLTTKVGKVFTKVMTRLEGSAFTTTLLKSAKVYGEYDDVLTIASKRFFEYSSFRQNFLLEIADNSTALTDAMAEATHIRVDDDVYVINAADTTPPKGTDVTWKIFCDRFETKGRWKPV